MSDCRICKDKTENNNELCPKCKKRQKSAKIIINNQNKVNFDDIITTKVLYELGIKDEDLRTDIIYTLYETNMIEKINNTDYKWVNKEKITDFVKKYDVNNGHDLNLDDKNIELNHNKCIYCDEVIQKPKTICKNCRKNIQTLKYLNIINDFENTFNYNYLMEKVSQDEDDIKDLLYNLIEHDLIKKIDEEKYQKNPEKIEEYLKENKKYSNEINKDKSKKREEKKTNQNKHNQDNESNNSETGTHDEDIIIYNPHKTTQINDYKTAHEIISNFLENQAFILNRTARKTDLTVGIIYYTFNNYLRKDNLTIEFSLFINALKGAIYEYNLNAKKLGLKKIKTKYDGKHVHYNITLNPFYKNRKNVSNLNIENSINFSIFNDFYKKHLELSHNDEWIKKSRLFQLFKDYASNKYDIQITEKGRGGFNDILNFKQDEVKNLTERIVNGHAEYNLIYVPKQNNIMNKTKENNSIVKLNEDKHTNTPLKDNKKSNSIVLDNLNNKENNSKNISNEEKNIDLTAEKNNPIPEKEKNNISRHTIKTNHIKSTYIDPIKKLDNNKILKNKKTKEINSNKDKPIKIQESEQEDDDRLEVIYQNDEVYKLLNEYLNKYMEILPREANSSDLTKDNLYHTFKKYVNEQHKTISYQLFAHNFHKIAESNKITIKRIFGGNYINCRFKKQTEKNTSENKNTETKQDYEYKELSIKSKNQKIDYDYNEIIERVNIINETLDKKINDMNDKISSLENLLENDKKEKEKKYSIHEKNLFELEKYLEISNEYNYLTFQDLYHILNQLTLNNNNIYNDKDLKDFISTFYEKNNLNINENTIKGKTFTYFMKISISNQNLITKITRELISNWITKNIVFSDNQQDIILFNDLIYEIVKSFKLENINKIYYNNIEQDLEMVLVSFYENNNSKHSLKKNNNLIICEGIKYQNKINIKEKTVQHPNEESIKNLTYDWLTENIIRTNDLNSKLALNDIYINIYPYLIDKNVSFKKTSLTREIGKSINIIFQGKNKIKREIVNNQTIYIGLQLKNPTMQENLTDSNQLSSKKPSELIEEWVDEKIQINNYNNKQLYMDKLISSFINDLNYKNIEIEDSTGLRSNMSRILRKFYKQKTNKSIDTAQDEQLKRYFKHIEIKD